MSLTAREQQALQAIEDRLAGSDPELASLLATFTRLTSSEEMPVRERVQRGWQWALRRLRRRKHLHRGKVSLHLRRLCQRLRWQRAVLLGPGSSRARIDLYRDTIVPRPAPGAGRAASAFPASADRAGKSMLVTIMKIQTAGRGPAAAGTGGNPGSPSRPVPDLDTLYSRLAAADEAADATALAALAWELYGLAGSLIADRDALRARLRGTAQHEAKRAAAQVRRHVSAPAPRIP